MVSITELLEAASPEPAVDARSESEHFQGRGNGTGRAERLGVHEATPQGQYTEFPPGSQSPMLAQVHAVT